MEDQDWIEDKDRYVEEVLKEQIQKIVSHITSHQWGVAMEPLNYTDYLECEFIPRHILSLANNLKFPLSLICCGENTHPFDVIRGIKMSWKQHNENLPSW